MKKLLTSLLILPVLFFSCSGDDDEKEPTVEELIIGTWTFQKNTTQIKINDVEAGKLIDAEFKNFDVEQKNEVYTFVEDGTYKKYDNINYPDQFDEGAYKILEGILYLSDNGFKDFEYTLKIVERNTLQLAMDWTEDVQEYPEFYGLEDYEALDEVVIEEVISIENYIRQ